jgi:hypothetical protein
LEKQTDLPVAQLETQIAAIMKEAQANQEKFDASTGNGSKKGVVLNIAGECA